jgi:magnesium transporter
MLTDLLKPEILHLIEARDWRALRDVTEDWPPQEIAELLLRLRKPDRVLLFRALPRRTAAGAFAELDVDQADALLRDLTDDESRALLETLRPDDRTQLLGELPGVVTQRLMNLLGDEDLDEAKQLLGYPEDSVGRLMTPDYVAIQPEWTVAEALDHVRRHGHDSETVNHVYVVDREWHLLDDIELRRLILAEPSARVEMVMDRGYVALSASADREEAVRVIARYDMVALPVLDSDGVLVGIVTVDDVLDVAEQEATEDFHKVGSVGPLRSRLNDAAVGFLYRKRIGWLLALVLMNVFSGEGIRFFEDTIAASVALVFFLPLLIDSGGNAGSQSATLVIRALATGDVRAADWLRLLGKELAVAGLMGLTMAAAAGAVGLFRAPEVAPVVMATMMIVVVVGSVIGMSLPFVLSRLRLDPAAASAPLVTSLADITGVLVYFSIATWYLGV